MFLFSATDKIIMVPIPNQQAATLLPLIIEHIAPGSWIISDGLPSYGGITNIQAMINGQMQQKYHHDWVNHQYHFIQPGNPWIHTQTVENSWKHAKQQMKHLMGTTERLFPTYLFQYMFRRNHKRKDDKNKIFSDMLFWIRHYYDV